MFYKNFDSMRLRASGLKRRKIAVAAAHDAEVLKTAEAARREGIADFVLVGDKAKIKELSALCGAGAGFEIIDEPDEEKASLAASELVRRGEADVLMKGIVNSSVFLKAALDKEKGLKGGGSSLTSRRSRSPRITSSSSTPTAG